MGGCPDTLSVVEFGELCHLTEDRRRQTGPRQVSMLVLELKSVEKEKITSRTATSAVNHISRDAVNTSWWCALKHRPEVAPFQVCIDREESKLTSKRFLSGDAASQGKFNP